MIFEIGKYYRHASGGDMAIIAEVETTLYGKALLAENAGKLTPCGWHNDPGSDNLALTPIGYYHEEFSAVGRDKDSATGWHEISKDEWMANFSQ